MKNQSRFSKTNRKGRRSIRRILAIGLMLVIALSLALLRWLEPLPR